MTPVPGAAAIGTAHAGASSRSKSLAVLRRASVSRSVDSGGTLFPPAVVVSCGWGDAACRGGRSATSTA